MVHFHLSAAYPSTFWIVTCLNIQQFLCEKLREKYFFKFLVWKETKLPKSSNSYDMLKIKKWMMWKCLLRIESETRSKVGKEIKSTNM